MREEEERRAELLRQRRATEEHEKKREEEERQDDVKSDGDKDDGDFKDEFKLMPCKALEMPIGQHVWRTRSDTVLTALKTVLEKRKKSVDAALANTTLDTRYLPFKYQKIVTRHEPCGPVLLKVLPCVGAGLYESFSDCPCTSAG